MRHITLLVLGTALLIGGCGNFKQSRVDDWLFAKDSHVQDVDRAQQGKLTAVELRSSMETIDKAILAEYALKGSEAELAKHQAELEQQSDESVAKLFNGDTGRSGDAPDSGSGSASNGGD